MKKEKGGVYASDLDIFGAPTEPELEEGTDTVDSIEATDMFGFSEPEEVEETKEEPAVETETSVTEGPTQDTETKGEDEIEDIDKWLDDLLKNSKDVEDKVDEVQSAAEASGDEEVIKLVEDLQGLIGELQLEKEELKKQLEISSNRYLTKFGDNEELSIYKGEIEKLQSNPRLMAFVKYFGTDNEKVKPKLITIASDFIYDLTGQDISSLLEDKDIAGMSVLNSGGSDAPIMPEKKAEADEEVEDNTLGLFGM